jgi:hypothetical protein
MNGNGVWRCGVALFKNLWQGRNEIQVNGHPPLIVRVYCCFSNVKRIDFEFLLSSLQDTQLDFNLQVMAWHERVIVARIIGGAKLSLQDQM